MVTGRELRREIIEYVGRISATGQEHNRPARTAPIEHFQPYIFSDADKSDDVR
jgi:hypothetical protein